MTTTTTRKPPEPPARKRAGRIRRAWQDINNGGRYSCGCGQHFRNLMLMNTHKCMERAGQWGSKAARQMARANGKALEEARRLARRVREYKGVAEPRKVEVQGRDGKTRTREVSTSTAKGRSRPEAPERGHLPLKHLRQMDRHDRNINQDGTHKRHRKAERLIDDDRGGNLTRRIRGAGPVRRARHAVAARHIRKGSEHLEKWPQREPEPRSDPAPAPKARENGSGGAPRAPRAPENGHRTPPPPPSAGRLAPTRTRTPR